MDFKSERTKIWKLLLRRIRDQYRLVLLNEETLEERISFKLSRLNVFIVIGLLSIILVFITTYIIAFTPLKEYIPGYTDVTLQRRIYELQLRSDSVAFAMRAQEKYLGDLRKVLGGDLSNEREMAPVDTAQTRNYQNIKDKRSPEDSLLRAEYESVNKYNLFKSDKSAGKGSSMRNLTFRTELLFLPVGQLKPGM
jgi:hypothetical protein